MRAALLVVCVSLLVGCRHIISEPYPDFTYGTIGPEKLPHAVMRAFAVTHPGARIERVETASFKGKVGEYCIWFRAGNGVAASTVFDRGGKAVAAPDFFRPGTGATSKRSAVGAGNAPQVAVGTGCRGTTEAGRSVNQGTV
jgi:hypothetical protein